MIIDCVNCSKKFEVNASLIPDNGRTIQCGSCNHVWFYKPKIEQSKNEISSPKSNDEILENKKDDYTNEKLSKADETINLEKFANTEPSSNELINENIMFDMMFYPMRKHGFSDTPAKIHRQNTMIKFWEENL